MMILNLYYSAIGILALVVHFIVNYVMYRKSDVKEEDRIYKRYLSVVCVYFITDVAWGIFNATHNIPMLYITTIVYYISMAFSVVLCCNYVTSFLKLNNWIGKTLNVFGYLFGFGEIAVLIINHFHHIFFWFDDDGNYQAFFFRYAALITQLFMFASMSIISFVAAQRTKDHLKGRKNAICLFGVVMTLALIAQTLYPLLPLYSVGIMLGTLIIYVFIHSEEQAEAFGVIEALSREYHTIWIVNKETLAMRLIRSEDMRVIQHAMQKGVDFSRYDTASKGYVDYFVFEDERERMSREVEPKEVLRQLSQSNFYAVNHLRRTETGVVAYYQIAYTNADTSDGVKQMVFGFRDIDRIVREKQAKNRELSDAKEAAEAANSAKTSFLFNMSHDIRTPMNAIIGFRDLLEKYQDNPEKRNDYLRKIEESSDVLLSIINNVLEMARIEKGTIDIVETAWSIEQFGDTIFSVFNEMMEQKRISFTHETNVQHQHVFCDPTKLRDVFINICSNAYKYTNPGGSVHMTVEELPDDREGWALYRTTVSDTGIGMSEDFLPHLFEEFSRENNTTHAKVEGTGLGMPIVKRLVQLMNGTIDVKSKKGEGTTFVITIPHRIADKADLANTVSGTIEVSMFQGKRILLAEDNDLNAEIAVEILSEMGFEVDRVDDGQQCVEKLEHTAAGYYDVVLMDIQMPCLNGYEATKAIRVFEDKDKAQIKILAMTANAFEEDKQEAMRAGMNGHIAKPIDVPVLMKELARLITI